MKGNYFSTKGVRKVNYCIAFCFASFPDCQENTGNPRAFSWEAWLEGWKRYDGYPLHRSLLDELKNALAQERIAGYDLRLWIGTDSVYVSSQQTVHFVTSVVIVRRGAGAYSYWRRWHVPRPMSMQERLFQEVIFSVEVGRRLRKVCEQWQIPIEIHVDVNPNPFYPSFRVYAQAKGYVQSLGFTCRFKPDAYASTFCAHRHL